VTSANIANILIGDVMAQGAGSNFFPEVSQRISKQNSF
jgi:hypothetical protein